MLTLRQITKVYSGGEMQVKAQHHSFWLEADPGSTEAAKFSSPEFPLYLNRLRQPLYF